MLDRFGGGANFEYRDSFPKNEEINSPEGNFENVKNWEEFYSVVLKNEITDSTGTPYDEDRITASIGLSRLVPFNLKGFTKKSGMREAAAKLFISEAQTFEQLFLLLDNIETISGSNYTYTNDELKQIIEAVGQKIITINNVTRSCGLQEAVKRCLNNNA